MSPDFVIKVCGVSDAGVARAALEAGATHLGLVFATSPRRVKSVEARDLVDAVPARWVGVFVDPTLAAVERSAGRFGLAAVQLHGRESPEFCRRVRKATGRPVWKALAWNETPASLARWVGAADRLLLDAGDPGAGGTGRSLPWADVADRFPPESRSMPIVLAGGLDSHSVGRAIDIVRPDGVDASSGLESAPGVKDVERVRAFLAAAISPVSAEP